MDCHHIPYLVCQRDGHCSLRALAHRLGKKESWEFGWLLHWRNETSCAMKKQEKERPKHGSSCSWDVHVAEPKSRRVSDSNCHSLPSPMSWKQMAVHGKMDVKVHVGCVGDLAIATYKPQLALCCLKSWTSLM